MNASYILALAIRARTDVTIDRDVAVRVISEADRALAYSEKVGRLFDRAAKVRGNPKAHAKIMAEVARLTEEHRAGR